MLIFVSEIMLFLSHVELTWVCSLTSNIGHVYPMLNWLSFSGSHNFPHVFIEGLNSDILSWCESTTEHLKMLCLPLFKVDWITFIALEVCSGQSAFWDRHLTQV